MDYINCISQHFPTIVVVCRGDSRNYDDVEWIGGDSLPSKETLDELIFLDVKKEKIALLSKACNEQIIAGFESDALGYPCIYDSEDVDQINILGVMSMISPAPGLPEGSYAPYAVRKIVDGEIKSKEYCIHSYAQLRKAVTDGGIFKLTLLQKFNDKRDLVNAATTETAISEMTWLSTP